WAEGADPMAAWWNQEGPGGWSSQGCQLRFSQPNASSLHCQHLGNVAVLMELSAFPREAGGPGAGLHPVVYPCTALLLLCLFSTIITYILNHSPTWATAHAPVLFDCWRDSSHHLWHHCCGQHPQLPGPQPLLLAGVASKPRRLLHSRGSDSAGHLDLLLVCRPAPTGPPEPKAR
uniref:Adhesion G protein-coupled receptor A2 n=1 Tax=Nannospalax galili TaxID=1026970 RepID=A0A8C6RE89_NANGA